MAKMWPTGFHSCRNIKFSANSFSEFFFHITFLNLSNLLSSSIFIHHSMRQYSDRSIISLIDLLSLILRSMNLPASTDPISLVLS